jgi:hypothetical protein
LSPGQVEDLTVYRSDSDGWPRASLRIKPIKGTAAAITGISKSEGGAHYLKAPSTALLNSLEQGPG